MAKMRSFGDGLCCWVAFYDFLSDPLALFFRFILHHIQNTFPGSFKNGNLNVKEWREREIGPSGGRWWALGIPSLFLFESSFSTPKLLTTRNFQSYMTTENMEQDIFEVRRKSSLIVCWPILKKKWKLSCWYYLKLLTNLNSRKWCMYNTYSFGNFAVHSVFSWFKNRNG